MLHKLSGIGCSDKVLCWFRSYLSCRKQRVHVVVGGQASDWASVEAGVPQGSIIGPLLFLIYINDIVRNIGANIRLFADDTSLYIVVDSPLISAAILNVDLSTIGNWADAWSVSFHAGTTVSMIISRKAEPPVHPLLTMNNTVISVAQTHKHLGLTLSSSCTWADHIGNICEQAWTRLNLMRALKFRVSRKSLEQIYISFIRPLLEYCDSVWDNSSTEAKSNWRLFTWKLLEP